MNRLFHVMICVCLSVLQITAQQPDNDKGIIERMVEEKDTTVSYDNWSQKFEEQIDSLLKNSNNLISKELYNLILKSEADHPPVKKQPDNNNSLKVLDGKIIRRIDFDNVDIFAPSVTDTNFIAATWVERSLNAAHIDTRKKMISKYLLFSPGENLDVFLVAENERILRDLSFIMDAKFIARPVKKNSDSVDLILLTQDKMPFGLGLQLGKSAMAELGINYQNLFGFGHQLNTTLFYDPKYSPQLGYSVSYGLTNLGGTYTTSKIEYINKWNQKSYRLDLTRSFRSISFRNAGGISYENSKLIKNIETLDTTFVHQSLKYTSSDFWFGKMIPLKYYTSQMRSALFFAARYNKFNNLDEYGSSDQWLHDYHDRNMLLFSTGHISQGFRKDNLIYTYGRTEDVPFGYLFDMTSGVEWREKTRLYFGLGVSYGTYLPDQSHIFCQIRFGTFIYKGSPEQGVWSTQIRYFSPLHQYNRFRYRSFVNFKVVHGISRYEGEFTSLANEGGIEGLTSHSLRGNDKVTVNYETVLFSPYSLLGFKFAFFGSVDVGLIKRNDVSISSTRLFSGFSTGVRIRNENLVLDTFVIRFGFYPGRPDDGSAQYFLMENMPRVRFNDFLPGKPDIIDF